MKDSLISKNKSLSLKFIAVTLMILLHTFAFPDRIKDVEYISLFEINGQQIEFYIGRFGSICVGMFTFISGYGLYISYNKGVTYKGILKRIYKLYLNYWLVFVVFISTALVMNKYIFNFKQFVMNFIGISDSYNGEWWFLRLYIMLLIIYPLIIKLTYRFDKYVILVVSFIANIAGLGLTKLFILIGIKSTVINLIPILLGGQFLFVLGIIIAKNGMYTIIKNKIRLSSISYLISLVATVSIISLILDVPIVGEVAKLILIPVFIFILSNLISENSILSKLGEHSTNMWLIHSFFCYYLFQNFTFASKYSVLITTQLIFVTIMISVVVNKVSGFMQHKSTIKMRGGNYEKVFTHSTYE